MYLTFEESSQQIQRFTSKFFPDQKSHIESSMIQIVDFSPQASQRSKSRVIDGQKVVIPQKENVDSVAYIEDKILDIRGQTIQRVAIDGLQTFASTFFDLSGKSDEEELRRILSRILVMLKDEGITTYLLSEEHDEETDKYAFINFTVDGVIMLKVNEALDIRTLKIMKMRGTGHTLKPVVIRFVEGTGII
jgi:KaiC/GvpD/RAD55 family RecA-like ATPase